MPANIIVAIGDTHGELAKLTALMGHVREFLGPEAARTALFVFLGDYVDRGPDSKGVIDYVRALPNYVALVGNHETMLVDAYISGDDADWMAEYGAVTCASFGVKHLKEIPQSYVAWMCTLPYYHQDGRRTFVHAGIDRRIGDMTLQLEKTMVWIRERFLLDRTRRGGFVVHGHTPVDGSLPELSSNRLNLDTGAVYGGYLSAAIFDDRDEKPTHYITHTGVVGAFGR
jgi:serine/threonine protein phosphatase 1